MMIEPRAPSAGDHRPGEQAFAIGATCARRSSGASACTPQAVRRDARPRYSDRKVVR
jgi:hypothetical protein